jgi:hypothetical protein
MRENDVIRKEKGSNPWAVFFCVGWMIVGINCAFPQKFWPQKDVPASDRSWELQSPFVLVASRSSDFKQLLVEKLSDLMAREKIGFKIIGIEMLETINPLDYDAIVIINTCLAWGLKEDVQGFIDRQERHDNMIVVTTSGRGNWLPQKKGRDFDAISSASNPTEADKVARNIAASVRSILKQ